jgi:hypothetical protein
MLPCPICGASSGRLKRVPARPPECDAAERCPPLGLRATRCLGCSSTFCDRCLPWGAAKEEAPSRQQNEQGPPRKKAKGTGPVMRAARAAATAAATSAASEVPDRTGLVDDSDDEAEAAVESVTTLVPEEACAPTDPAAAGGITAASAATSAASEAASEAAARESGTTLRPVELSYSLGASGSKTTSTSPGSKTTSTWSVIIEVPDMDLGLWNLRLHLSNGATFPVWVPPSLRGRLIRVKCKVLGPQPTELHLSKVTYRKQPIPGAHNEPRKGYWRPKRSPPSSSV